MSDATIVWDRQKVQNLIATNDRALAKALWNIFQRQTSHEQSALQTNVRNGVGFNSRDARFLSDIARRLPQYDFHMTSRQIAKVRPMMRKYWRQLLEEIEKKGGQVSYSRKSEVAKEPEGDFENASASMPLPPQVEAPAHFGAW